MEYIKYLITFPILHAFPPKLNDYLILFLSIFCSFLWIKHQFNPKHFWRGEQFVFVQIYQTYILYLFFLFWDLSLLEVTFLLLHSGLFSRPAAELASWESSFIIILRISFTFLCLVSPSLLDPIHFSQLSFLF